MKQLELDICANKHKGNANSIEANPSDDAKSLMRSLVLSYIESCGAVGATSEEISIALDIPINRVSGRCSELKKYNMVKVMGTRFNRSGKSASVLIAR